MPPKKAKSKKEGLRLVIDQLPKLELVVDYVPLSSSTAGGSGPSLSNVCSVHQQTPLKQPKTCADCGPGVEPTPMKAYKTGDTYMPVPQDRLDAIDASGEKSIRIVQILPGSAQEMAMWGPHFDAKAIVPLDQEDAAGMKRWAAILQLLHHHPALAQITTGRSFRWAYVTQREGVLVAIPAYLHEDLKDFPHVAVPELSDAERKAFEARGEQMVNGELPVFTDPYRKAREEAIMAALRGETPVATPAVEVAPKASEDLVSLLG